MRHLVNIAVVILAFVAAWMLWKPLLGGQPLGPPRVMPATAASESVKGRLRINVPEIGPFNATTSDALNVLGDLSGIYVNVDWGALKEAGIDKDAPIRVRLAKNVSVEKNLALVLTSMKPAGDQPVVVMCGDCLLITTPKQAQNDIVGQFYDVRDFIAGYPPRSTQKTIPDRQDDSEPELQKLMDDLAASIEKKVDPKSWRSNGGRGDIKAFGGCLLVINTRLVQADVSQELEIRRWMPGAKSFAWRTLSLLIAVLLVTNLTTAIVRRYWRKRPGHCPNCGYDLRETPDRCPECGAAFNARLAASSMK